MNGEINNYISGDLYQANGVISNTSGKVIGTLSGNLFASNINLSGFAILTGHPIITCTDDEILQL